jgi:midasin
MTFLTQLNKTGQAQMQSLIDSIILEGIKRPGVFVSQVPKPPSESHHILFRSFWIQRGPLDVPSEEELASYVLTPAVELNLVNLARAVMSHRYPILIQGPTSSGKTSMIEYIAKKTGHRFVRINNHEHTDLSEYIGNYVSDESGKLVFQEVF